MNVKISLFRTGIALRAYAPKLLVADRAGLKMAMAAERALLKYKEASTSWEAKCASAELVPQVFQTSAAEIAEMVSGAKRRAVDVAIAHVKAILDQPMPLDWKLGLTKSVPLRDAKAAWNEAGITIDGLETRERELAEVVGVGGWVTQGLG